MRVEIWIDEGDNVLDAADSWDTNHEEIAQLHALESLADTLDLGECEHIPELMKRFHGMYPGKDFVQTVIEKMMETCPNIGKEHAEASAEVAAAKNLENYQYDWRTHAIKFWDWIWIDGSTNSGLNVGLRQLNRDTRERVEDAILDMTSEMDEEAPKNELNIYITTPKTLGAGYATTWEYFIESDCFSRLPMRVATTTS